MLLSDISNAYNERERSRMQEQIQDSTRAAAITANVPNQSMQADSGPAGLAARRRGTHEKFTAAVDKARNGDDERGSESCFQIRYHFSLKLMEK